MAGQSPWVPVSSAMSIRLDRQSTTVPKMSKSRTRSGLINDQYSKVAGHCFSRRAWRCCGGNHSRGGPDDRSACDCLNRNRRRPPAGLEPDAIGPAQDTIIGMANAAPAVSVGLTLAALAAAAAYAVGPIIVLTAVPMLIIANAYRRLNLWKAQCGASFEWVGRSINPYLGFMTGWLMITGTLVGVVSGVVVLAPSVLAVFGSTSTSTWPNILISTAILLIMVVIAIVGIRITARIQVGMGLIEYVILIGFAITGLVLVLSHHHGTFPITKGWFTVSGIGGKGSLAAGFLIAVFMYTGWDARIYVNEETPRRTVTPGRAAVLAVLFLAIIFTI